MRLSRFGFLALILPALAGCGTFKNLKDPPNQGWFLCDGTCYPFGGVARSGLLAAGGPVYGLCQVGIGNMAIGRGEFGPGFQQVGNGLLITSLGLGAILDTPLSLAGDVLTLPIVYARSKEHPWAMWWGEIPARTPPDPLAPYFEDSKTLDGIPSPSEAKSHLPYSAAK